MVWVYLISFPATFFGLNKYPLYFWVLRLDGRIDFGNSGFNFVGGFLVVKINADIRQYKIRAHVQGKYFVDVIDAVNILQNFAYIGNDGSIRTFTD